MSAAYFYDAEGRDREIPIQDIDLGELTGHQLVWFDVEADDSGLKRHLAGLLDLEPAALLQADEPVSGLVMFDGNAAFDLVPASISDTALRFVIGSQWLVTVRGGPVSYFEEFRERDRGETLIGRLSPLALASSLTDWHLEEYHRSAEALQHRLDELDTQILHGRHQYSPLVELTRLRRTVARLRTRLETHRPLVHAMVRPDFVLAADDEGNGFLKTLEAHYERAEDALDRARQFVAESFELYATRTAQNTNDLVRALTIVTVAIGLSAALAGIFGMNFDIPLFHTGAFGFGLVTGCLFLLAGGILFVARRKDWL